MSAASAAPLAGIPERASFADWMAVAAATLGSLMALLDVSIVNASLPVIQGEIGATQSEGTWVGTSYLVAEVVVIPLTAWLERMLGLRRLLLISASLFTVFSVLCGFATDLTTMIAGRVGQGLAGGTLIPAGLVIMAKRLPPSQQAVGLAAYASSTLIGPIVGPLLGGWITENYSWHYAFFINVPVCALLIVMMLMSMPAERGDRSELANGDWFGIFGITMFLGSITLLLEEGHREQWFQSSLIWKLAVAGVIGFIMVAVGQLRARRPVLQLALLRNPAMAAVVMIATLVGGILFSTLFLIPQFLATIAGYNSMQAGDVLFISGFAAIGGAVLFPFLIKRVPVQIIVAAALLILAAASYLGAQLTSQSGGDHFRASMIIIGFGLTLTFIPLQQVALSSVPVAASTDASSLFVVGRNLGASIGLAALASFFDQRIDFHHWRLLEGIDLNGPELGDMARSGVDAGLRALDGMVMREALAMAFSDMFFALAILAILAAPLAFLLRKVDPARAGAAVH